MIITTVYQSLEDRNNLKVVRENGPFPCKRKNAWLGEGFYFWDTHIELAHWWGKVGCSNRYYIGKSSLEINQNCWDLHGNGNHQKEFEGIIKEMAIESLYENKKTTVRKVIEYIKKYIGFENLYEGIRVLGCESISSNQPLNQKFLERVRFSDKASINAYFDVKPAVQLCLFESSSLNRKGFEIVYPEYYDESTMVI
jgi:hypothetical protein